MNKKSKIITVVVVVLLLLGLGATYFLPEASTMGRIFRWKTRFSPQMQILCNDTDGGLNYVEKGIVTSDEGTSYVKGGVTTDLSEGVEDYCVSSKILMEGSCSGNTFKAVKKRCLDLGPAYTCIDGACREFTGSLTVALSASTPWPAYIGPQIDFDFVKYDLTAEDEEMEIRRFSNTIRGLAAQYAENCVLRDEGFIVAGPVDPVSCVEGVCSLDFNDQFTLSLGINTLTLSCGVAQYAPRYGTIQLGFSASDGTSPDLAIEAIGSDSASVITADPVGGDIWGWMMATLLT